MFFRSLCVAVAALGAATALTAPAGAVVTIIQLSPNSYFYVGTLPSSPLADAYAINEAVTFTGLSTGSAFSLSLGGSGTADFSNLLASFGGTSSATGANIPISTNNTGPTSSFSGTPLNGVISGSSATLYLTGLIGNAMTVAQGTGSYSGTLTVLASSVPEASSWAMMTLGFGALGYALRRRRVEFAHG